MVTRFRFKQPLQETENGELYIPYRDYVMFLGQFCVALSTPSAHIPALSMFQFDSSLAEEVAPGDKDYDNQFVHASDYEAYLSSVLEQAKEIPA